MLKKSAQKQRSHQQKSHHAQLTWVIGCSCLSSSLFFNFPWFLQVYSKTLQLELLELSPLALFEGQNILISPTHINVVLDYAKYGMRDSGVLFSTVPSQMPKHGRLAVEVWEKAGSLQTFTLLDLIRDKVCTLLEEVFFFFLRFSIANAI